MPLSQEQQFQDISHPSFLFMPDNDPYGSKHVAFCKGKYCFYSKR
jgi:hypothetical protein